MNSRAPILLVAILTLLPGQEVAPPPNPAPAGLADSDPLNASLSSLRKELLAAGRLEYSATNLLANGNWSKPNEISRRITNVETDAPNCRLQIHSESSSNGSVPADLLSIYFLESLDPVETLTMQDLSDGSRKRAGLGRGAVFAGTIYELAVDGNGTVMLFGNETQARRAAEDLVSATRICRSIAVAVSKSAGSPSLADTLGTIRDKLNNEGPVDYRVNWKTLNGPPSPSSTAYSYQISESSIDELGCQVRYVEKATINGSSTVRNSHISFRRVNGIGTGTAQDLDNNAVLIPGSRLAETQPKVYRLFVEIGGSTTVSLNFRDPETAGAVAKAMIHATELCGSWGGF